MRIASVGCLVDGFGKRPLPMAADSLLQVSGRSAEGSIVAVLLVQIRCDHIANCTCDSQHTDDGKHGIYKQFKAIHTLTPLIRGLPRLRASDLIPNLLCDGLATDSSGFLPQVGSGTDVRISFPDTHISELVGDVIPSLQILIVGSFSPKNRGVVTRQSPVELAGICRATIINV